MIKERLEQDLKQALLAGDKFKATVIRGLKSVILYAEVEKGVRDTGLEDEAVVTVFSKEAKKRQESADLYIKGGDQERADKELAEKKIIEEYLPQQLSDEELAAVVQDVVTSLGASGPQAMGQVIGAVKQKTAGQADGGRIADMVKAKLQ